jgi:hypothetical protein
MMMIKPNRPNFTPGGSSKRKEAKPPATMRSSKKMILGSSLYSGFGVQNESDSLFNLPNQGNTKKKANQQTLAERQQALAGERLSKLSS